MTPRSALFIRTETGTWTPIAYHGADARSRWTRRGTSSSAAFATCGRACAAGVGPGGLSPPFRVPLHVGPSHRSRRGRRPGLPGDDLDILDHVLREHALRLDAALVFDEVRSLATVEERQRLAREIHDGVAQELASLGYLVDELADTATTRPRAASC